MALFALVEVVQVSTALTRAVPYSTAANHLGYTALEASQPTEGAYMHQVSKVLNDRGGTLVAIIRAE